MVGLKVLKVAIYKNLKNCNLQSKAYLADNQTFIVVVNRSTIHTNSVKTVVLVVVDDDDGDGDGDGDSDGDSDGFVDGNFGNGDCDGFGDGDGDGDGFGGGDDDGDGDSDSFGDGDGDDEGDCDGDGDRHDAPAAEIFKRLILIDQNPALPCVGYIQFN